jgi:hypothetical protein
MTLRSCLIALIPLTLAGTVDATVQSTPATCEVTATNGVVAGSIESNRLSHGNSLLSTFLWPDGTIVFKPGGPGFVTSNGSLGMKFMWIRGGRGKLEVTGRRLDGAAPPLRTSFRDYGDHGIQPSHLIFSTPGCWEVTAHIGGVDGSAMTFVTRVVKIGDGPAWHMDPDRD